MMCAIALIFTARRYASAVCAIALSVCLSVLPSLSQVCVLLKRLIVGLCKQRRTIAQGRESSFSSKKSRRNSTGVTPYGGAKYRWGRLKFLKIATR